MRNVVESTPRLLRCWRSAATRTKVFPSHLRAGLKVGGFETRMRATIDGCRSRKRSQLAPPRVTKRRSSSADVKVLSSQTTPADPAACAPAAGSDVTTATPIRIAVKSVKTALRDDTTGGSLRQVSGLLRAIGGRPSAPRSLDRGMPRASRAGIAAIVGRCTTPTKRRDLPIARRPTSGSWSSELRSAATLKRCAEAGVRALCW